MRRREHPEHAPNCPEPSLQQVEARPLYNRRRRHSAIDKLSAVNYEERYWDRRAAA
jgi:transposase InsO family protein